MDFYFKVLSENLGLLSVRSQTADSEDQRQVGKREKNNTEITAEKKILPAPHMLKGKV